MKRTIEKLTQQRRDKEDDFKAQLEELKKTGDGLHKLLENIQSIQAAVRSPASAKDMPDGSGGEKRRPFPSFSLPPKQNEALQLLNQHISPTLTKICQTLEQNLELHNRILTSFFTLMKTTADLMDVKDKEWDALGSNHVGMIFKSLEWRVDKLAADYRDASLLMKKFIHLKEKMNELLTVLENKHMPTPRLVEDVLNPLEDWRYASFENRYRGSEEEIKERLKTYLPFFAPQKNVLDLGCGRGEFLSILKENGIEAEGVDINEQMIDICRDKGLNCRKADILDTLASLENLSLGGIFSAQVIEHMPPEYLKRVIELAFHKLAPSGCIVLETINPTSVFALVQIYYLDLSHQKPIHPHALKFLLESTGFEEVELKFFSELLQEKLEDLPQANEASAILNRNIDKLNSLLFSPPDYAAIGKKA